MYVCMHACVHACMHLFTINLIIAAVAEKNKRLTGVTKERVQTGAACITKQSISNHCTVLCDQIIIRLSRLPWEI